jgi:hypothetical protein
LHRCAREESVRRLRAPAANIPGSSAESGRRARDIKEQTRQRIGFRLLAAGPRTPNVEIVVSR